MHDRMSHLTMSLVINKRERTSNVSCVDAGQRLLVQTEHGPWSRRCRRVILLCVMVLASWCRGAGVADTSVDDSAKSEGGHDSSEA